MITNIILVGLIFLFILIIHVGNNVNDIVDIVEKQVKAIGMINNKRLYHDKVLLYVVESVKTSLEFIYDYGSDEDRLRIMDIVKRYNENIKND